MTFKTPVVPESKVVRLEGEAKSNFTGLPSRGHIHTIRRAWKGTWALPGVDLPKHVSPVCMRKEDKSGRKKQAGLCLVHSFKGKSVGDTNATPTVAG